MPSRNNWSGRKPLLKTPVCCWQTLLFFFFAFALISTASLEGIWFNITKRFTRNLDEPWMIPDWSHIYVTENREPYRGGFSFLGVPQITNLYLCIWSVFICKAFSYTFSGLILMMTHRGGVAGFTVLILETMTLDHKEVLSCSRSHCW